MENTLYGSEFEYKPKGSSPLTWRIHISIAGKQKGLGIISTYVENTESKLKRGSTGEDHLHLRGEYLNHALNYQYFSGSSPLTWRIQDPEAIQDNLVRIISTYVENTRLEAF